MIRKFFSQYCFGFDWRGLVLFILVMVPNFIWFAVEAPNDVLRSESVTPIVDLVGSIFQVLMVAALCMIKRKNAGSFSFSFLIRLVLASVLLYFAGWIFYYKGIASSVVILLLTVPPCMSFLLYSISQKNWIALFLAIVFTVCHVIFGVVNFMI